MLRSYRIAFISNTAKTACSQAVFYSSAYSCLAAAVLPTLPVPQLMRIDGAAVPVSREVQMRVIG